MLRAGRQGAPGGGCSLIDLHITSGTACHFKYVSPPSPHARPPSARSSQLTPEFWPPTGEFVSSPRSSAAGSSDRRGRAPQAAHARLLRQRSLGRLRAAWGVPPRRRRARLLRPVAVRHADCARESCASAAGTSKSVRQCGLSWRPAAGFHASGSGGALVLL